MIILKKRKRCNVQSLATIPRQHMTTTVCERTGNTVQRLFTEEDAAGRHQHWETAVILSHLNLWIEYLFCVNHRRLRKDNKRRFWWVSFCLFQVGGISNDDLQGNLIKTWIQMLYAVRTASAETKPKPIPRQAYRDWDKAKTLRGWDQVRSRDQCDTY